MLALDPRQAPQPLDRAGERELRAAQALDEVATSGGAQHLQVGQLAVEDREAARDALGQDRFAGHDP